MTVVSRQTWIDAPPQAVWRGVANFAEMPKWFYGVRAVRTDGVANDGHPKLLLKTLVTGRTYRERITAFEEGESLAYTLIDTPFLVIRWSVQVRMRILGRGTLLSWRIEYEVDRKLVARLLGGLVLAPILGAILQASLKRLRCTVEARSERPSR